MCSVPPSRLEAKSWKSTLNLQQIRVFQVGIYEGNEKDLGRKTFLNVVSVVPVLPFHSFLYCYVLIPSCFLLFSAQASRVFHEVLFISDRRITCAVAVSLYAGSIWLNS